MARLKLEIWTGTKAFGDDPSVEVGRIIQELGKKYAEEHRLDWPGRQGDLFDKDGNLVGKWVFR